MGCRSLGFKMAEGLANMPIRLSQMKCHLGHFDENRSAVNRSHSGEPDDLLGKLFYSFLWLRAQDHPNQLLGCRG